MTFFIHAGPIQDRQLIARGDLLHVAQGLDEYKIFWNGEENYDSPTVSFAHNGGTVLLELKRTAAGWAGTMYKGGCQYGCNLNRVRRSTKGRWGLTVWRREKSKQEVRRVTEHDLSGLLEALR